MKCHIFEIHMKELINEKQSQLIYSTKAAAKRKPEKFRLGGADFFFCTTSVMHMPVQYVWTRDVLHEDEEMLRSRRVRGFQSHST